MDYQFRLNWRATANYRRGVEYLAVLTEPMFSDGARVGLTGLISRRVDVVGVGRICDRRISHLSQTAGIWTPTPVRSGSGTR